MDPRTLVQSVQVRYPPPRRFRSEAVMAQASPLAASRPSCRTSVASLRNPSTVKGREWILERNRGGWRSRAARALQRSCAPGGRPVPHHALTPSLPMPALARALASFVAGSAMPVCHTLVMAGPRHCGTWLWVCCLSPVSAGLWHRCRTATVAAADLAPWRLLLSLA